MNTAILVVILIVMFIAVFYFGILLGSWSMGNKVTNAILDSIHESDLTNEQRLCLIEKMKEAIKKNL